MKFSLSIVSFLGVLKVLYCSNILVVIPTPHYSHQAIYRPLWRELAKRGHNVTILTTYMMEDNVNITQIDCKSIIEVYEQREVTNSLKKNIGIFEMINNIVKNLEYDTEQQLMLPGVSQVLNSGTKFDLLFIEAVVPIFAHLSSKLKCPYIFLNSMDAFSLVHGAVGNAAHPALYPYQDLVYLNPLTFTQRLLSTILTVFMETLLLIFSPMMDELMTKHLEMDEPDTYNIYKRASLVFINSNPIFYPPRPITPLTVNLMGGLHLAPPKLLPKDIQEFLDNSTNGFIYFSFGSTVKNDFMGKNTLEVFEETFMELSHLNILWKFDNASIINKPDNVMIKQWVPQQDVLRHPNIKLFITQGGLHSMEEALHNAVPMLAIPFYGDQHYNAKVMSMKKFGIQLDKENLTKAKLRKAIEDLLDNPIYRSNIRKLSRISRDQPTTSLEKAVWWTEYVLRHNGTEHLRSPSADIPLYQYFFLDILALASLFMILFILICYYCVRVSSCIFRKLCQNKKKHKVN